MNRRQFLKSAMAAAVTAALPVPRAPSMDAVSALFAAGEVEAGWVQVFGATNKRMVSGALGAYVMEVSDEWEPGGKHDT